MQIEVDTRSPTPAYEQIRSQITGFVLTGTLQQGNRLPPIRQLAGHLGLSNGAVARAYKELEREGTVISRGKNGTTIAPRPDGQEAKTMEHDRAKMLAEAATTYGMTAHSLGYDLREAHRALDQSMHASLDQSGHISQKQA